MCESSEELTEQVMNQPQQGSRGSRGIQVVTSAAKGMWLTLNKPWLITIRVLPATLLVDPLWEPVLIREKEMSSPSRVHLYHFRPVALPKVTISFSQSQFGGLMIQY